MGSYGSGGGGGGGSTSGGSSSVVPARSSGGTEEDLQVMMDQRKRKRMVSNRESARRSRMRKQKHLDDLMNQVSQLKKENNQIANTYNITTDQLLAIDAENSVLRTQMMELNTRFHSLNEILGYMNAGATTHTTPSGAASFAHNNGTGVGAGAGTGSIAVAGGGDGFINPWNLISVNQPIMASPNMFFC
ncbi:Basic-leucine zipper (bZIP) transcription factor family [Zostera marina]|uniref:Basic-leucine zipper (BZIP) transcription factor family n=1 Tax=Zostera marina TaxID=29655 RepID=A0A0K9NZH2_ZOSMR|nr:Basic-leucine zipper (bZIP) transcription factor family [Zostera marina]